MKIEEFTKLKYCEQKIIGESEEERPLYVLKLRKGKGLRKKALLVSCLHGQEPDTLQTNLKTLEKIMQNDLLNFWEITSIPIANPDGKKLQTRCNARGIDLNRDFIEKKAKETKAIIQLYKEFKPEIVLDYHSNLSSKYSCVVISKNTGLSLCERIIFSYEQKREQTNLATHIYVADSNYNKVACSLGKGIYMLEQGKGFLIDYADNKSKIAALIEEYETDLGVEFSTELLKNYINER